MTDRPPLKPLSPQDWDTLIDDFQYGGSRRQKWTSIHSFSTILDLALSSLLKKDFPLYHKLSLIIFLEEFSLTFFDEHTTAGETSSLDRLNEAVRSVVQSPVDNLHITYALKEQLMVSATSIFISIDALRRFHVSHVETMVELLLTLINRPNHSIDRHTRATACECLREFEKCYPCLLSDVTGHLWALCQSERTHASQSYLLLFTTVVYNLVTHKLSVSVLSTTAPLVPFNAPQWLISGSGKEVITGLNHKELRRAMSFLLEWPQVLTPCGMVEFAGMIMPLAVALELQVSMLKVQFFGMIYSFDPLLCHLVLMMYFHLSDAFDGQEVDIVRRLMLLSRETQQFLVFRMLAVHWLLGMLNKLMFNGEVGKKKLILEMGSRFYPSVFDPLALKALKLDLLARCSISINLNEEIFDDGKFGVKLFQGGLVSVSAFKWLPPWSAETAVALRSFHKFLIGASSHSDSDPSTTRTLMECNIFRTLQGMLVDMALEFQRLVPVIVSFVDRLLSCLKHRWLGERLLQTIDERLLSRVSIDYGLVSYFPIFDRIAENDTIPLCRLLELLTKFMVFLVDKHGPHTGVKSWSRGSKVLGICRTMMMHHQSSRLFLGLSRLLAFTCLYFPDLEVRDHARIYLRMLISVPGLKLRDMLNFGDQLLDISPAAHPSSFFNIQSPRHYHHDFSKSRNVLSYIHLERVIPLLVKQSWSLSLSSLGIGGDKVGYLDSIRDSENPIDENELESSLNFQSSENEKNNLPRQPLRVMDSKISEILGTLRRYFSCIPDFRHMSGLKVRIQCILRFESEPFNCKQQGDSSTIRSDGVNAFPAIYATVLKFSSSAPYGSIPPCRVPFLLGEPPRNSYLSGQNVSLDIVPMENGSGEFEEGFKAPVTIYLEPREPTPGLIDVSIETNSEDGEIICGQLQSITVGIEDMFLKAMVPSGVLENHIPSYYSDLFSALWEACGTSSSTGRETFPLKGGKGAAAINGTQSVKLLEVPAEILIQATERYLATFVVSVIGEELINRVKDRGVIRDISWKEVTSDSSLVSISEVDQVPVHLLTYTSDKDEKEIPVNISKRNMGCFHVLIFLPPRFHLLFQMEVSNLSSLVRVRTDNWPCLAYIDDYLEGLFWV